MSSTCAIVIVTDETGLTRHRELLSTGLAWPPSELGPDDILTATDESGNEYVMQSRPLELWPDGSIRWLGIDLLASVPASQSCRLTVRKASGSDSERPTKSSLTAITDGVNPHPPSIQLRTGTTNLLEALAALTDSYAEITDSQGKKHRACINKLEVEQDGPIVARTRLYGTYGDSRIGLMGAVTSVAHSDFTLLDVGFVAREMEPVTELAEWKVVLGTTGARSATCGAYDSVHQTDLPFSLRRDNTGYPHGVFATATVMGSENHWVDVSSELHKSQWEWSELEGLHGTNWLELHFDQGATLFVAVKRFLAEHPSELAFAPDAVTIGLWPRWAGPLTISQGMAKTVRIALAARPHSPWNHRDGERIEHPLTGHQPAAISIPGLTPLPILPYLPEKFPNLERHIRNSLASWFASGQARGLIDYGDDMGAVASGPRTGYSANNEHDALFALCLHYIRKGDRAIHDSAEAYANHLTDVDVIHFSTHNDFEVGGVRSHGWRHTSRTAARTKSGTVTTAVDTAHIWVEGLLLFSSLSNQTRYRDAAVGIGDCLLRLVSMGWARPEPGPRNAGWPLIALTALAKATNTSTYLDAAQQVCREAIAAQDEDGAWRMRLGFRRSHSAWHNAVLLTGISRLHELNPSRVTRATLDKGFRALLDQGRFPDGSFINYEGTAYTGSYETALIREALAAGFLHTNDQQFLDAGLAGGHVWYGFGNSSATTRSLSISEWRGHLPFLRASADAGLLTDLPAGKDIR